MRKQRNFDSSKISSIECKAGLRKPGKDYFEYSSKFKVQDGCPQVFTLKLGQSGQASFDLSTDLVQGRPDTGFDDDL